MTVTVTHKKDYEIRTINSDKVIGLYILLDMKQDRKPHKVECWSVFNSEVTRKVKQSEVEGEARAPVSHSWRRQYIALSMMQRMIRCGDC